MRVKTKFRMAHSRIRAKAEAMLPLTATEKKEVLTNARALLTTNFGTGDWRNFVGDVEQFCMYGAMESVCGFNPEDSTYDKHMSACSLTSTLFDALPDDNQHKVYALARFVDIENTAWYSEGDKIRRIMDAKVVALQLVNDQDGQAAVLRVFDVALENLDNA